MVLAVAEKWVKLAEDRMRQDLQALEELDIPEHLKLELREELEQMYGEMKRDALQMAARKDKVPRRRSLHGRRASRLRLPRRRHVPFVYVQLVPGPVLGVCGRYAALRGLPRRPGSPKFPI